MIPDDDDAIVRRRPGGAARVIALLAALLLLLNLARLAIPFGDGNGGAVVPEPSTSVIPTESPTGKPRVPRPLAAMPPEIRAVARDVERIRGLRFLEPVDVRIVDQDRLDRRLTALIEKELDRDEIRRLERTWRLLGLIDPGVDLFDAIIALNTGGVAGFYDEETEELLVATVSKDELSPAARYYVAHELTHALTDQHFGLDELRTLEDVDGAADEAFAFRALVEGDAVIVANRYATTFSAAEVEAMRAEMSAVDRSDLGSVPEVLLDVFGFPYRSGVVFAQHLHAIGGFRRIDRAYERRPLTTREILHPETFPARRPPDVPVKPAPRGWNVLDEDAFGEFDVQVLLDGADAGDPEAAAEGWRGGRYLATGLKGRTAVEVVLRFANRDETAEAAEEFSLYLEAIAGSGTRSVGGEGWSGFAGREASGGVAVDRDLLRVVVATDERALRLHIER